MSQIKIGCQLYTWQMSGMKYAGKLSHLSHLIGTTGYSGIESETWMLGNYYENPQALKGLFDEHNLQLGGIVLVENWSDRIETDQERENAELIFTFLETFADTHLVLCQMPGENRSNLSQRQKNVITCINSVAARASDRGISCSFHPNSPTGSVFIDLDDYKFLLDQLDEKVVGFAPDTGHISKGNIDVIDLFSTYIDLVRHVHFKDMDASTGWTAMGEGVIDFPRIIELLRRNAYTGWVMVEEESPVAEENPDVAAVKNWEYIQKQILPLL